MRHRPAPPPLSLSRRDLLRGLAGVGAAVTPLTRAMAAAPAPLRYVGAYFSGGWDLLLTGDARDPSHTYPRVDLGTSLLAPEFRDPLAVSIAGREGLWGAPMASLVRHADTATVFRGVNMATVAHPTGMVYAHTGMRPVGNVAKGPSLGSVIVGADADSADALLPNIAIDVTSYDFGVAAPLRATRLASPADLMPLLGSHTASLPLSVDTLLASALDAAPLCEEASAGALDAELTLSRERLRKLQMDGTTHAFDFAADTPTMADLRGRYGITTTRGDEPAVRAASAGQLLRTGMARAVTVELQTGLDHHRNWGPDHPVRLAAGFTALAALLDDLREDDPNLDRTVVYVYSEFGRTPTINGFLGRDHWFTNNLFVFGGPLRRGYFGASADDELGVEAVDLVTGLPSADGVHLTPEHIAATLLTGLGLSAAAYRVDALQEWIR